MDHERSPEGDIGPDRKRRRKVLSCTDCRRRKVQCDRAVPVCGRCEKAGKPCGYEDDGASSHNGQSMLFSSSRQLSSVTISKEIWDDMLSRLLQQERQIERLQNGHGFSATPKTVSVATPYLDTPDTPTWSDAPAPRETILFRGKGFKSVYYGPSDSRSPMTLIPDAHSFFREEISRFPALVKCRRDVEKLRAIKKALKTPPGSDKELISYLPDRSKSDALIKLFIENVDSIYGIVHFPTFQREYEGLWQNPRAAKPAFVAVVLLMMACVQCFVENKPQIFVADSSLPRETAVELVDACESWISKQSQKHTDLAYFQILCLLLVAKQASCMKMKRRWLESGNLFRLALSAGLHRHTDLLQKKTAVFEQEMRRRIWAFIVEWDLQTSLDRGMPAVSSDIVSDCGPPCNLYDEDFDEKTVILPSSRPLTELTKMTYLRMSNRSQHLRKKVTTLLNQPVHHMSYDDVLAYTREFERHMAALPEWTGYATGFEQNIALLHIQLEQFLLILHGRAARQATTKTQASFSKQAFLTASGSIVKKLSDLFARGSKFLVMVRLDLPRIFTSVATLGNVHDRNIPAHELRSQVQPSLEVADKALDLFEQKIISSGGLQWTHTFSLYDMLLCKIHPLGRNMGSRPGSDRIFNVCKTILDHQDPVFTVKADVIKDSIPTPKKKKKADKGMDPVVVTEDANHQPTKFSDDTLLPDPNYSDMLDWSFDDWMLYTDDLWLQQGLPLPSMSQQDL